MNSLFSSLPSMANRHFERMASLLSSLSHNPSDSGKSTLLNALSSRLTSNAFLTDVVLLNGKKTKLTFSVAAYVTQDDNLIGTLTVREMIIYSARLRLPDEMEKELKRVLMEGTIVEMGLQDCADTMIKNSHLRGISGG